MIKKNNLNDINLIRIVSLLLIFMLTVSIVFIMPQNIYGASGVTAGQKGILRGASLGKGGDGKYYLDSRTASGIVNATNIIIGGKTQTGYCINHGQPAVGGWEYKAATLSAKKYSQLPSAARKWIPTILVRGYHTGKASPVKGTTSADYYMATQYLIWDFTDGYRTSPTSSLKSKKNWNLIKNRPAGKVYKQLLKDIENHSKGASFMANISAKAKNYKMKYNYTKKCFELKLSDSRKVGTYTPAAIKNLKCSRSGYKYTFTTSKALKNKKLTFTNNYKAGTKQGMLVGQATSNASGRQGIAFGAKDDHMFYINLSTEKTGKIKIIKTSDDGLVEGVKFSISGNGLKKTLVTDGSGKISYDLYPGKYTIKEVLSKEQSRKYISPKSKLIEVKEGKTASVNFNNILIDNSKLKIKKATDDGIDDLSGFKFQIKGIEDNGLYLTKEDIIKKALVTSHEKDLEIDISNEDLDKINTAIREGVTGEYEIELLYIAPDESSNADDEREVSSSTIKVYLHNVNTVTKEEIKFHGENPRFQDFVFAGSASPYDKTMTTDSDGLILNDDIKYGRYTITELLDENQNEKYRQPESQTIVLNEDNQDVTVYFENITKKGSIKIIKTSEDGIVENVEFIVSGETVLGETVKPMHFITDSSGVITDGLEDIIAGSYNIQEVLDDNKYQEQAIQSIVVKDGERTEVYFNNLLKKIDIEFSKVSALDGEELPGAQMRVVDKENETTIDEWISTDKPHKLKLIPGREYTLKEDLAPLGYLLANEIEFTAGDSEEIRMVDEATELRVEKLKKKEKSHLKGAILQIIDKENDKVIEEWTTKGEEHSIYGLIEGHSYILHEKKAPDKYLKAEDITFEMEDGKLLKMYDEKAEISVKTGDFNNNMPLITLITIMAITILYGLLALRRKIN